MSLHGTIETFALPDVLALLSSTTKSGELRVVGDRLQGRLWFDDGRLTGQKVGTAVSFVDAVFELLRLTSGEFDFDAGKAAPDAQVPTPVEPVLAEAQSRLVEWREIETVVPSLQHTVRLSADLPGDQVTMRAEQWRLLVAVAAGHSVQTVIQHLGAGEFDTCRQIKELAEAGLVAVEAPSSAPARKPVVEPAAAAPTRDEPPAVFDSPPLRAEPAAPVAETPAVRARVSVADLIDVKRTDDDALLQPAPAPAPAPEPEAEPVTATAAAAGAPEPAAAGATGGETGGEGDGDGESDEAINRGLLLKFLSSVRS